MMILTKKISNYLSTINSDQSVSILEYFILFAIIFFTFYYGFASYAIENMNEGLYAEIPREMLVLGNYIIPHLNFVPYLEKPPLLYWLIALNYHIFGISTFAARLVPAIAATFTCLGIFLFAKTLNLAKSGWIASIILATSIGFIIISRVIIFDMLLTAMFSLSIIFFYLWYVKDNRYFLWFSYLFLGLAFLTKGLLSLVLISSIAILFLFFNKTPWKKFIKLFDITGMVIFLTITLPWVITASIKQPNFAWDFFINEQTLRFLNQRIPHDYHTGPVYFYILPLLGILLPWTILLPTLLKKTSENNPQTLQLKKFLWLWFLVPFIFFSLSQAKAVYYIIIGIPAVALLLGLKINEYFKNNDNKTLLNIFRIFIISYTLAVIFIGLALHNSHLITLFNLDTTFIQIFTYKLLLVAILIISLSAAISYFYRNLPIVQFLLIAILIIPWVLIYVADKNLSQSYRSEIAIGQLILTQGNQRPVYLYQDYEKFSSILFYVKQRMAIIDTVSQDLYFGAATPAAKDWFISTKDFVTQAQKQSVYVVIFKDKLKQFNNAVLPLNFCEVTSSGNVALLSNRCNSRKMG